jgi:hypothetical protein
MEEICWAYAFFYFTGLFFAMAFFGASQFYGLWHWPPCLYRSASNIVTT